MDDTGTDGAECRRKVANGKWVAGAIKSLFNAREFQIDYGRILHETLFVPVLTYVSETML